MVLNDIIEQAAGRQSRSSEQAGNVSFLNFTLYIFIFIFVFAKAQ